MALLTKLIHKKVLNFKQRKLNRDFEKNGLTDENLEKQVKINIKRHEWNIPDENNKQYGDFVQ